uniref:lysosomal thioesterase PPT2-like isoform X2 n=1 Tax=Scatophagus argus TaxID=75038 RepID=UPI001ED82B38|nr:lysosomal thioesterase PPT2-like isoform X2 [Scatophagus argus]
MKSPQVHRGSLLLLLLLLLTGACIDGYKPVIIVHGILDGPKEFETLSLFITKVHPGTEVMVIDLYDYLASLKPLWKQVQGFRKALDSIMQKAPDGVHLLCFSQGGLICRALLSMSADHNVHTFIALSSPLAGQYGDTDYLKWVFPKCTKKVVFHICYNRLGQKVSICDYWNDATTDVLHRPPSQVALPAGQQLPDDARRRQTSQQHESVEGKLPAHQEARADWRTRRRRRHTVAVQPLWFL